ncbi:MAG TPA: deoxyguanosinetriphosphate triphosphohydrolase [Rhizomicrobium sp.]|jgi:dGTPase|nr:deoxyguanosinetriphosphate triphosphohydrolase [Rhizomicrobium sp.]
MASAKGQISTDPPPPGHLLGPLFIPPPGLAVFATTPESSRGRLYPERESPTRTCYSRDRDRIIHSSAFRRLKHKTQVFVQHEGDYYRTRLTHSIEVAQLARTLARTLAIDEDLAEAVALAHDLGHTPFGHSGEEALNAVTADIGGFDHNAHALRLVTKLEHRYADFDGLNLTWETLEGLVKHNGPIASRAVGPILSFDARWPLDLTHWPGLEAQVAALADDIAYVNHDIDDGLRAGLFTVADLAEAPLAGPHVQAVRAQYGELELSRFIGELIRRLMSALTDDVLAETRARLAAANPTGAAGIRTVPHALAGFSADMMEQVQALKKFLFIRMYRHPRVIGSMSRAQTVITDLFETLAHGPEALPEDWKAQCGGPGDGATRRVVRDYIAGMTDNYALAEYGRVIGREARLDQAPM